MNFALTQEVSEAIINNGVSNYVIQMSDELSALFISKDYGEGLQTIYIGIICVSPEFDFFFKPRRPKYKKGHRVSMHDGRAYEMMNGLTYDIKLEYSAYVDATENKTKQMLSKVLLSSLSAFDHVKIKTFDRTRFEADLRQCLEKYL